MKNLVIAGGGTAGWLTALYAKNVFPNDNVSVIHSKDIGILGAGEGATPHLIGLLDYLDIPVSDLISNTKSTLKLGIKFTNWSENKESYFHPFSSSFGLTAENKIIDRVSDFEIKYNENIVDFLGYSDGQLIDILEECSKNNLVPFSYNDAAVVNNPIGKFDQYGKWSLHFDAKLLANRLEEIAIKRGINSIEGTIKSINSAENGDIESLLLDNDTIVNTDFIFDCTGFSRFFVDKHFKSEWESFSDILPMKKALPFFIDIDKDNIPPYTESIAMEYGWMWKIPLQHRYGCGYVYDSDFISDDDARKEIEKFLGFTPEYPRISPFLFNPGCYKEVWNNNCLAVGLSSAFVEPLEATSIFQTIALLRSFFGNKHNIFTRSKKYMDLFNRTYLDETKQVVDFISLHYVTNKNSNLFWNNFLTNNLITKTLEEKLALMNESILYPKSNNDLFSTKSYYRVFNGLEKLNIENINKIIEENNLSVLDFAKKENEDLILIVLDLLINHSTLLKDLGGLID
jgi:tryptophan 7-halogenase